MKSDLFVEAIDSFKLSVSCILLYICLRMKSNINLTEAVDKTRKCFQWADCSKLKHTEYAEIKTELCVYFSVHFAYIM